MYNDAGRRPGMGLENGPVRGLSIRLKLVLAFTFFAVLVGAATYYRYVTTGQMNDRYATFISVNAERVQRLEQVQATALKLDQRTSAYLHKTQEVSPSSSYKADFSDLLLKIEGSTSAYKKLPNSEPAATALADGVAKQAASVVSQTIVLLDLEANGAGTVTAAERDALQATETLLNEDVTKLLELDRKATASGLTSMKADVKKLSFTNVAVSAVVAVAAIIIGFVMSVVITRSIGRVKEGADRIGSGDFSRPITVESHDEVGRLAASFNQMADRLRESYNRLALERQRDETLLESMSDGLIAVDDAGKIVLVNSQAAALFELGDRASLQGKPVDEVLHLNQRDDKPLDPEETPTKRAVKTAQPVVDVYTFHPSTDKKTLVNINMSPVVLDEVVVAYIMVVRDVTQEQEVDRMKTEFISLASHQLRTPLSAIRWFSEMLLSGDAGDLKVEQKEFAKNIYDSAERMIDLVNSLLNISRIESGRIVVEPKPTDLSELVHGIVTDLKAKTEEREQTLVVSVHKDLPKVNLDPHLIGQVYLNFLTNAIKYTPKGGEISVFVSRKGDELLSQITDNGYGIPKEQHERVFQKFFRAENIVKVETDGTGLGLYLVKAIIESSGGRVWFESEEGKGTTFWFALPISGMKAKEGEVTLDM